MILSRKPVLRERARAMRKKPTDTEARLWSALRAGQINGLKFRRQAPVGPYIADFFCVSKNLVVEIDGETHAAPEADTVRDAWMRDQGIRIVRYANRDVRENLSGVLQHLAHLAT